WSGPADFTVNATLGQAPRGLTPSGTISNNRPTFTWVPATGAVSYEILVKNISQSGQPTVINVSGISANVVNGVVSYTTTTTLAPNQNYRWWVRGYSASGIAGPWSQPLNFSVVSSEQFGSPVPMDPMLSDIVVPVVATLNVSEEVADDVRSFSVHPAGMHIQLNPARLIDDSEDAVLTAPAVDTLEIDSVMELWADGLVIPEATAEVLNEESVNIDVLTVDPASVSGASDEETASTASALFAGLFALSFPKQSRDERRNRRS
ncbi:MAG: hypothetical protein JNL58_23680, partial [Planctomyces sp.]|nr:hypothetical protein [Planctomyces sp.]